MQAACCKRILRPLRWSVSQAAAESAWCCAHRPNVELICQSFSS